MRRPLGIAMFAAACLWAVAALAVLPDERLADPALEARARQISAELRCLVCQNQSIDESDASLARDLRLLVRERITAGDTDEEVRRFLVGRYGEFVLLKPEWNGRNALLWGTPVLLLLLGGAALVLLGRRSPHPRSPLSPEEERRLAEALRREE